MAPNNRIVGADGMQQYPALNFAHDGFSVVELDLDHEKQKTFVKNLFASLEKMVRMPVEPSKIFRIQNSKIRFQEWEKNETWRKNNSLKIGSSAEIGRRNHGSAKSPNR